MKASAVHPFIVIASPWPLLTEYAIGLVPDNGVTVTEGFTLCTKKVSGILLAFKLPVGLNFTITFESLWYNGKSTGF